MYGTAKGGYSLYGVPLGVLMLEAKFPRIEGYGQCNNMAVPGPALYCGWGYPGTYCYG